MAHAGLPLGGAFRLRISSPVNCSLLPVALRIGGPTLGARQQSPWVLGIGQSVFETNLLYFSGTNGKIARQIREHCEALLITLFLKNESVTI